VKSTGASTFLKREAAVIIFKLRNLVGVMKGVLNMDEGLINVEDVKSVFKEVGLRSEECNQCMGWTSPKLDNALASEETVLAELTPEEQGFFRCMGYVYEEKVVDTLRLRALYETFWLTVRSLHDLPPAAIAVREGKYIVAI